MPARYFADTALLDGQWARDVLIEVSAQGRVAAVTNEAEPGDAEPLGGTVVPGMPNLHSHAFQRAMAGSTERARGGSDDFWSWRGAMYALANRLTPEQLRALAAQAYLEMLEAGYTAVAEFHYLHHDDTGRAYAEASVMSQAIVEAAAAVGMRLTLLPVLYMTADFDGRPPAPEQRRFVHDVDDYLALLGDLRTREGPQVTLGVAFHSLRAVPPAALETVLAARASDSAHAPVHIHIAEQPAEVAACRRHRGCGPVRWLLDHCDIDGDWCLIHATHADDEELSAVARSGCTVGLCPTTEANLGDGVFALERFLEQEGTFGIGSDSNTSISPVEELRWLEYGQRLRHGRRNVSAFAEQAHVGTALWTAGVTGGSRACGHGGAGLQVGGPADLLVLDDAHPVLFGKPSAEKLDALVFSGNVPLIRDVMVGGRWRVREGTHAEASAVNDDFRRVVLELACVPGAIEPARARHHRATGVDP